MHAKQPARIYKVIVFLSLYVIRMSYCILAVCFCLVFVIYLVCVQYLSSEYLSSICDRQVWCSEEGPSDLTQLQSLSPSALPRTPPPSPCHTTPHSLTHNSSPLRFISYFWASYFVFWGFCVTLYFGIQCFVC